MASRMLQWQKEGKSIAHGKAHIYLVFILILSIPTNVWPALLLKKDKPKTKRSLAVNWLTVEMFKYLEDLIRGR